MAPVSAAFAASSETWFPPAAPVVGSSPEQEEQDEPADATILVAAALVRSVLQGAPQALPAERVPELPHALARKLPDAAGSVARERFAVAVPLARSAPQAGLESAGSA